MSNSKAATLVLVYLLAVMVIAAVCATVTYFRWWDVDAGFATVIHAACLGAIGGSLRSSREVIRAVRYNDYLKERVLWQLFTPLHSPFFAVVGVIMIKAGILSFTHGLKGDGNVYTFVIMSLSFLIGFSSELFIKKLIQTSESFFGEKTAERK